MQLKYIIATTAAFALSGVSAMPMADPGVDQYTIDVPEEAITLETRDLIARAEAANQGEEADQGIEAEQVDLRGVQRPFAGLPLFGDPNNGRYGYTGIQPYRGPGILPYTGRGYGGYGGYGRRRRYGGYDDYDGIGINIGGLLNLGLGGYRRYGYGGRWGY